MTPSSFGRYTIIHPLGVGGMADVYLARDRVLGREVAIKVPRLRPEALARFEVEAKAIARLEHPAIVPLYEYGDEAGRPFMVMRHMRGGSLSGRLARRTFSPAEALRILDRIAAALDYAHSRGVIHRDVKPGNILFDDYGQAFLSDFGIARLEESSNERAAPRLTVAGAMPGSPAYLSPEQARGARDLDGRSDVYSLGVVVYEMLTGGVPYPPGPAQQAAGPPSIQQLRPDLPAAVQPVIERALAADPQVRYGRAADLVTDLRRAFGGAVGRPAGNTAPALLIGGLLLVGLAFFWLLTRNSPSRSIEPLTTPTVITTTYANGAAQSGTPATPIAAQPAPTAPPTNQPTLKTVVPELLTLGHTARDTPIEAYRFGDGPQKVIFVGGLTGGYAPSTEETARAAVDYFSAHPESVPESVTAFIIPLASPDAPLAPGEFEGRLNANGVDINRNWGCAWAADTMWEGRLRPGSGGSSPFSEVESRLLRDFILTQSPAAVVAWHARANDGLVSPGGCGVSVLVSAELAALYRQATGYRMAVLGNTGPTFPGDATNWLDSIGIPAISVLLPSFSSADLENNLAGMIAVIDAFAVLPPVTSIPAAKILDDLSTTTDVATHTGLLDEPTPISPAATSSQAHCQTSPGPRWEDTLWQLYSARLGCPVTPEMRGITGAFQRYQHGMTVWRQDLDLIYVLYDNGTFSTYPDDSSDFQESDLVKGGFGYLWRNNPTVYDGLGQPQSEEANTEEFAIQDFLDGVIFYFYQNDARNYALFNDNGTWTSVQE